MIRGSRSGVRTTSPHGGGRDPYRRASQSGAHGGFAVRYPVAGLSPHRDDAGAAPGAYGRGMIRGRIRRHRPAKDVKGAGNTEFLEIDVAGLRGIFGTPGWLRDLGVTSWLLVGVTLLLVGVVWLLSLTQHDRDAADRGRHRRRGRVAARGLAAAPRRSARPRGGAAAARRSSPSARSSSCSSSSGSRARSRSSAAISSAARHGPGLARRTPASSPAGRSTPSRTPARRSATACPTLLNGVASRHRGAVVAGLLPCRSPRSACSSCSRTARRSAPGPSATWASRPSRAPSAAGPAVAARLLRRASRSWPSSTRSSSASAR